MRRAISAASVVLILMSLAGAQSYTVTDLGPTSAFAVNDRGQVAGSNGGQAFVWTSTTGAHLLGSLGGGVSLAASINNLLQVVGYSFLPSGTYHAFLWTPIGGMQDLGTLGGSDSVAYGINDSGQVVRQASSAGDASSHAFLWIRPQVCRTWGALVATPAWQRA
jgi:probable HAF family extracellular repeat protein